MSVVIKRSASYAGQLVKLKKSGSGLTKIFNFFVAPTVVTYAPGFRFFESSTIINPAGTDRLSVYGGIKGENDLSLDGIAYNTDVSLWDIQIPLPSGEVTARGLAAASATTPAGDLMVIGGIYSDGSSLRTSSGSRTYNVLTNTWTTEQSLPGIPPGIGMLNYFGNYSATDFANERVFLYTKYAGTDPVSSGVPTALDKFHAWDGTSWSEIDNDPVIFTSPSDNEAFTGRLSMAVRDAGSGNSIVLIHTGTFGSSQTVAKWTQTQTVPVISGTWELVTGSNSPIPYSPNPMPMGPCCLMWESNRNRWTAISAYPDLYGGVFGTNIWTSTNDGSTWTAYNFNAGAFDSNDWMIFGGVNAPTMTPDPDRNRVFIAGNEIATEAYGVWIIDIALNPSDSTMVKAYTSPALPPAPPFTGRINTAFGVVKLLDNTYRVAVYGGNDGAGTVYSDGWLWNPSDNTWTQMEVNNIPGAIALTNCQGLGAKEFFYSFGGHGETPSDEFSGAYSYSTNGEYWNGPVNSVGFSNALEASVGNVFCSPNRLVAANNSMGTVYRYGGWDVDYGTVPKTYTWVNNFYYGDYVGGPINDIHGDVEVFGGPPPPQYVDPPVGSRDWTYWLTARNLNLGGEDKKTMLMLFTGSWNNTFPQEYVQSIWRWEQTDVGFPNSGNWTFVTGSTGAAYSPNPMPIASVAIMWDENYYRWTAISADPGASPNMWTSTDDGATWTSYTYSNSWPHAGASPRADGIAEDPDNSRFYLYKFSSGFKLYELQVAASPGDSTLIEVFAE